MMMQMLRKALLGKAVLRHAGGATAAEYALILGILGAAVAVGAFSLGNEISNSLGYTAGNIRNCAGGC